MARRFVELLVSQTPTLDTQFDLQWTIIGITTARHGSVVDVGGVDPQRALATRSLDDLDGSAPVDTQTFLEHVTTAVAAAADPAPLVVVENTPLGLDGGQPGLDHVRAALAAGAHVVTANKGPAAFAYRELRAQARSVDRQFRFEGTVLDGLPVFNLLEGALPAIHIRGFRGVVNTTTNHILSAMEQGQSLDAALAEMQAAGVTEADPSNDVEGWDAAAKAAVLANALMDARITPHDVERVGLRAVTIEQINEARRHRNRVKLVASGRREGEEVVAAVRPTTLAADDPLAVLDGTAKGLELETDLLGTIHIGKSQSGVDHTAYALLADLVAVRRTLRE